MRILMKLVGVILLLALAAGIFVWSGVYNVGADAHHWPVTEKFLSQLRERSIESRASGLQVPNLDDPQLVLKGAGQYAAMCTACHLAPGIQNSELREGMYPLPPNLSERRVNPKEAFWVIKHGIKMSAMPAWGVNHDDATIWSMVAFLQKLPGMSPQQYKEIVAKAPPDEDMGDMDHSHAHDESPDKDVSQHGH